MADPTQPLRDSIAAGIKSLIPSNSPLAQSSESVLTPEALAKMEQEKAALEAPVTRQPTSLPQVLPSQIVTRQPVQPVSTPQAPSTTSNLEGMVKSGLSQQQTASDQALTATDALMSQFEQESADRAKIEEQALAEVRTKIDSIDNDVKNFQWDNKSIWEKSSTGQKIALAIGGFLSSLTPQGAQAFQNSIDTTMKNDLDQQKAKYMSLKEQGKELQSYYGQLVQKFGSEQAADMAMMSAKMGMIQNKLKITADTAQSKLVAANALKGLELTDAQMGKYKAEAMKLAAEQKAQQLPGYTGQVKDPAALRELQTRSAAKASAETQISALEKLLEKGATTPFSGNKKLAEQTRDALAADLAKAMFGRSSDAELEIAKNLIPDVTSFMQPKGIDKKLLQNLRSKLNSDVGAYAKAIGLKPVGQEIGRIK
jgi:hypothetical protein